MANNRHNVVFADPTVDIVFKKIFSEEEYSAAAIDLINSFIPGLEVKSITHLNTVLERQTKTERTSIIDVLAMDDEGNNFVIEMQSKIHPYFRERMVFYASKVISHLKKDKKNGEKKKHYYDIKGTYVIAFIDDDMSRYDHDDDFSKPIIHYHCVNSDTGNKMVSAPEYFFVQLRKDEKSIQKLSDNEKKWLTLLRESKFMTKVPVNYADNPAVQAYFEASRYMNMTSDEQIRYDQIMDNKYDIALHEEMICNKAKEEGRAEGLEEGRTEGEAKKQLEIARAMKAKGLEISMIAECTGLTEEQIKEL